MRDYKMPNEMNFEEKREHVELNTRLIGFAIDAIVYRDKITDAEALIKGHYDDNPLTKHQLYMLHYQLTVYYYSRLHWSEKQIMKHLDIPLETVNTMLAKYTLQLLVEDRI